MYAQPASATQIKYIHAIPRFRSPKYPPVPCVAHILRTFFHFSRQGQWNGNAFVCSLAINVNDKEHRVRLDRSTRQTGGKPWSFSFVVPHKLSLTAPSKPNVGSVRCSRSENVLSNINHRPLWYGMTTKIIISGYAHLGFLKHVWHLYTYHLNLISSEALSALSRLLYRVWYSASDKGAPTQHSGSHPLSPTNLIWVGGRERHSSWVKRGFWRLSDPVLEVC
jgi:hypothetical protein